jgi:excisionase family DNA binding protein
MRTESTENELLTEGALQINDAVTWSGIGRSKLYMAMAEGDLSYVRVGKRRLIPKRALRDYLASRLECEVR